MTWMIFAFIGALLWALVHHLDKLLLTRFSVSKGVGSLLIFSTLFPILVLPVIGLYTGVAALLITFESATSLIIAGVLGALASLFYFQALYRDDTTVVVSMYQLSPVFGYILGIFFLGETLDQPQIFGAIITILGVTLLSFEFFEERRVIFRTRTTVLMVLAAFAYAFGDVIFKVATLDTVPYLVATFWMLLGYIFFGLAALLCVREYRENFLSIVRQRSRVILGLNILNECLQTGGVMLMSYALLLAPVALVLVMDSYQPILVFIIGILLTAFAPSFAQERLTIRHLLHKATAIVVAVIGTVLIQFT